MATPRTRRGARRCPAAQGGCPPTGGAALPCAPGRSVQDLTGAVDRGHRCTRRGHDQARRCCSPAESRARGSGRGLGAGSRWRAPRTATRPWPSRSAPRGEVIVTRCLHRSRCSGCAGGPCGRCGSRGRNATRRPGCRRRRRGDRPCRLPHIRGLRGFLGDPSYVGTIGDLAGHADAAQRRYSASYPTWAAYLGSPRPAAACDRRGRGQMVTSARRRPFPEALWCAPAPAWTRRRPEPPSRPPKPPAGRSPRARRGAPLARDGNQARRPLLRLVAAAALWPRCPAWPCSTGPA